MARPSRYSPEVRERAVRMVWEHQAEYDSEWAAIGSIASKIGCTAETLRKWVRQAERDAGRFLRERFDVSERRACSTVKGAEVSSLGQLLDLLVARATEGLTDGETSAPERALPQPRALGVDDFELASGFRARGRSRHGGPGSVPLLLAVVLAGLLGSSPAAALTEGPNYAGAVGATNNFNEDSTDPSWAVGSEESLCGFRYSDDAPHNGFWKSFGFSIPAGAVIQGIEVEYKRSWDSDAPTAGGPQINIGKNESTLGTPKGDFPLPGPLGCGAGQGIATLGGPTDLWGLSWTPAEINSPDFTVRFFHGNYPQEFGWRINWIRVTVHYTPTWELVKRAFQLDGTPIADTSVLPTGTPVRYLLYINNTDASPVNDVSLQDVLDGAYGYVAGSIRVDNSVAACAAATCTPAEEAAIFAAVDAQTASCGPVPAACTDVVDGDPVSFDGTDTVDAGNQNQANGQLDIAAGKVWAILFTVTMQ